MSKRNGSSILSLSYNHDRAIRQPLRDAARGTCTHRDQGAPLAASWVPPARQTSVQAMAQNWLLPDDDRAAPPIAPIQTASATAISLSAPRPRVTPRERQLGADDLELELRHVPEPQPAPPHFLNYKNVDRLPLNVNDEEAVIPQSQQASPDVFDRLQQQFTYANTFNLGRFSLDEHFSKLEEDISRPAAQIVQPSRNPPRAAALSKSDIARGLAELLDGGEETPEQDQPQYTAQEDEAPSEEEQPESEPSESEDTYEQPGSPGQTDEEHAMARSIMDIDRAVTHRRTATSPATGGNDAANRAAPPPSQAIANAQSRAKRTTFAQRAPIAAAFGSIDYDVPGPIPQIRQPDSMSCWATVYTMLRDWKTQSSMEIRASVNAIGSRWAKVFDANTGLASSDKVDFLNDAGLVARPPQSYAISGWRDMLVSYGPLWVTTDEDPSENFAIHARLLYCMRGNGTPGGTRMFFVDPADGQRHNETFAQFLEKYESEARAKNRPLRIQVVHWPQGARSMSVRMFGARAFDSPRGIRNNNPGNIRLSNQAWEGKVPNAQNTDHAFEQFSSYAYGVRALIKLLRNYITRGRNTVVRIISNYAPSTDNNDTENYIMFVVNRLSSNGLNVNRDTPLTVNRQTLRLLCQGIARMETGAEAITDAQFDEGFALLSATDQQAIGQSLSARFNYYAGFGENDGSETEGDERDEDSGIHAQSLEADVPAFCPLSSGPDAQTPHFRLSEFHSHDGIEVPIAVRGNVQSVMEQLEVLRAEVGKPIKVTSGFRSVAHNKSVGGEDRSRHLCGMAADIKIDGTSPREVHACIENLIAAGRMTQGGLGLYKSFVHYDIRGNRARWDKS